MKEPKEPPASSAPESSGAPSGVAAAPAVVKASEPAPVAAPEPPAGGPKTPAEHAPATGNTFAVKPTAVIGGGPAQTFEYSVAHNAAAVSHGWIEHSKHTADAFKVSEADYSKALEAALIGEIHPPAQSPYTPEIFKKLPVFGAAKKES